MKRRILVGLALFGIFLLVVTARVVYSSRQEYVRAGKALKAGRTDIAIVHYRRAAHWYAPGNPYSKSSLDALWNIADQAEGAGRVELALAAYRAIRSSILGTRSFYTPHKDLLAKVNPRIAALMARQELELKARDERIQRSSQSQTTALASPTAARRAPARSAAGPKPPSGQAASATPPTAPATASAAAPAPPESEPEPLDPRALAKLKEKHLRLLKKTNMPSVGWSLVAILGLFLWVGSAFAFAYRAVTFDDRLIGKKAILWGSLVVLGLAVWVVGLAFA